ncbi:MAG: TIGR02281 family clan AA aspartic protease [Paracoccaceae bacterium]
MQNWIVVAFMLIGAVFVLRSDFTAIFTQKSDDVWLGYLSLILAGLFLGHVLRILWRRVPGQWRSSLAALALVAIFGLVEFRDEISNVFKGYEFSNRPLAALATTKSESQVSRSWDGHFRTLATINGTEIAVLVDTGASLVLLRYQDAKNVGVNIEALDFSIPVTTAMGRSVVAPVVFDKVQVGSVTVPRVRGAVARPGELHASLLGMSFLEGLLETVIRKDRLILRN